MAETVKSIWTRIRQKSHSIKQKLYYVTGLKKPGPTKANKRYRKEQLEIRRKYRDSRK